jgi:Protein of unknown function (DUF3429)
MTTRDDNSGIPATALVLGLGGVIPFVACAMAAISGIRLPFIDHASAALIAYGAVILSFLGGVRWGFALRMEPVAQQRMLVLSVIPSLLAWGALLLAPRAGLALLAACFVVLGLADQRLTDDGAPPWFARLRLLLTVLVTICLTAVTVMA